jgi:hypothetical protein
MKPSRRNRNDYPLFNVAVAATVLLMAFCLSSGCTSEPSDGESSDAASPALSQPGAGGEEATGAEVPAGDAATAGLPVGHPRIETASPASVFPPVDSASGTGENALSWTTPEGWISEPPANEMRRAQYRVPGEAGDAECAVFYFGPGRGGEPMQNAERWASQFNQPDGSDPIEAMSTETIEVNGATVLLVETAGTYGVDPMSGGTGQPLARYMLLGAIAEGPDANWFFKFTGPEETVRDNEAAFHEMVRSLQPGSR